MNTFTLPPGEYAVDSTGYAYVLTPDIERRMGELGLTRETVKGSIIDSTATVVEPAPAAEEPAPAPAAEEPAPALAAEEPAPPPPPPAGKKRRPLPVEFADSDDNLDLSDLPEI
jgi:hypothetical protein